jgi:hypothetical protein
MDIGFRHRRGHPGTLKYMAEIDVRSKDQGETRTFEVTVREGGSESRHEVTVSESDLMGLGAGYASGEEFVRACFEFLLAREPKEQILSSFDVTVISRYFPEFEEQIRRSG